MVKSAAMTVAQYLDSLPIERRQVVAPLRDLILRHLPPGYAESMNWGMISYEVPLARYPSTYNGQPLAYAALAAQKNGYSLYLMGLSMKPEREQALRDAFRAAGKKLDMGKACVRFGRLDDLPLDAIAAAIAGTPVQAYLADYEASRPAGPAKKTAQTAATKKATGTAVKAAPSKTVKPIKTAKTAKTAPPRKPAGSAGAKRATAARR
ncbi:DUF1801 domain-containing protein [Dokdonella koreensis]|uniref:Protein containing DUF1801 n=1 Tax=Dokdonella koreensis DS-123 TaxID=1300342 RepID=A0A167G6H3_9GAMM|nr:DUF1801 domain-containing protein [Dokdonella koreensis]ANB16206.1 Protein containing DUF1801 [Dokdonella koreensis DS-123]